MIEQELSGIREQQFHKQGANGIEVAQIQERLKKGESPEQISSDMMIALECVQSFVGADTDASNFEALKTKRLEEGGPAEAGLAAAAPAKVEKPAKPKAKSKKSK